MSPVRGRHARRARPLPLRQLRVARLLLRLTAPTRSAPRGLAAPLPWCSRHPRATSARPGREARRQGRSRPSRTAAPEGFRMLGGRPDRCVVRAASAGDVSVDAPQVRHGSPRTPRTFSPERASNWPSLTSPLGSHRRLSGDSTEPPRRYPSYEMAATSRGWMSTSGPSGRRSGRWISSTTSPLGGSVSALGTWMNTSRPGPAWTYPCSSIHSATCR